MTVSSHHTLTDVFLDRADSTQTITFVAGQDQHISVTLAAMLGKATQRLGQFQSQGLSAGSQLIIQCNDNSLFLEAFWACMLGGITAVPVAGGNTSEHRHKLFRIAAKLDSPGLFTEAQNGKKLAGFAREQNLHSDHVTLIRRAIIGDSDEGLLERGEIHVAQPDDTAFIQFSSGSTSTPKGVVLTHKNLIRNTQSIIDGCLMTAADHLLSWMPLTHDMGLIGFHLTPVVCNVSHSLMPTDAFVRRPALWLTESATLGATILCSPNFGYQHLLKSFKPEKHDGLDLSCVRLMFNGAEPISLTLCERFMHSMAPFNLDQNAMLPVYGLAEASLAVTFPPLDNRFSSLTIHRGHLGVGEAVVIVDKADTKGVTFVAVGKPVNHVSIEIRDNAGVALTDGATGHICIHGENVTGGYFEEPALNQETIDSNGWLNTGDLGFVYHGQLYITGRAKDIVFVSGQNVYPHDLEEIVIQAGLVERGKLAISSQRPDDAMEEELIVFVLHRTDADDLQETARAVTRLLGEAAGVRVHAVVPVTRIPKTTSGKVQRFLLVNALQSGEVEALIQPHVDDQIGTTDDSSDDALPQDEQSASEVPNTQSTAARLQLICQAQVADMNVGMDDNLFDLGISSLTLAQIHAAIEDEWPDQVDITDLFDYPTVTELAVFLDSKGPA